MILLNANATRTQTQKAVSPSHLLLPLPFSLRCPYFIVHQCPLLLQLLSLLLAQNHESRVQRSRESRVFTVCGLCGWLHVCIYCWFPFCNEYTLPIPILIPACHFALCTPLPLPSFFPPLFSSVSARAIRTITRHRTSFAVITFNYSYPSLLARFSLSIPHQPLQAPSSPSSSHLSPSNSPDSPPRRPSPPPPSAPTPPCRSKTPIPPPTSHRPANTVYLLSLTARCSHDPPDPSCLLFLEVGSLDHAHRQTPL